MSIVRPTPFGVWPKVLTDNNFHGQVALGNGTQYSIGLMRTPRGALLVSVLGKGSYEFTHYVHFSYAMEKLGLRFAADARNISDFINTQIGEADVKIQGDYQVQFCLNGEQ